MQTANQIEVWRDATSDNDSPAWCVSVCTADGDEIECLHTEADRDDAITAGRGAAEQRGLPLYERSTDGSLGVLVADPRPELLRIAQAIEDESQRQVIGRLGYTPGTWYTGGSGHNDYRLTAAVDGGEIMVRDGAASEPYSGDGTAEDIESYVSDWLDMTMPGE